MKKFAGILVAFALLISTAKAAEVILFDEDWEQENFSQWSVEDLSPLGDDHLISDGEFARSCPGYFSDCGVDSKNDYAILKDDAMFSAEIDATNCLSNVLWKWSWRTKDLESSDKFRTHYRLENQDWTQFNITNIGVWTDVRKIIPDSAGKKFQIRYWLDNGNGDIGALDDISLECDSITDENPSEVPEFTGIGMMVILLGAGIYLKWKRRKQ